MTKLSPQRQAAIYGTCEYCGQPRIVYVETEDGTGHGEITDVYLGCTVCEQPASQQEAQNWRDQWGLDA